MKHGTYRRGQPVMTLVVVLSVWVAARAAMWEPAPVSEGKLSAVMAAPARIVPLSAAVLPGDAGSGLAVDTPTVTLQQHPYAVPLHPAARLGQGVGVAARGDLIRQAGVLPRGATNGSIFSASPPAVPYVSPDAGPHRRRWSADGWLLLRDGGASSSIAGPARATYGASQLGAVLRYRLAPESGYRPTAYLRGTAALVRPYDREVATGLSARPLPGIPFTLAAELRVGEINSTTRVRPAIMAVTELLPQQLPLGLLGEAYAQAGYVGGTGATAFVDGQLRVDAEIARIGGGGLRLGGGAWGGAQKDASRFDLGPAVNLGVSVNDAVFARVMVDWRFRVAGNAVPESGPALTLSAGF